MMEMALLISDTQQDVLRRAVNSGNAKFIAECIVNIEEIIGWIKNILNLNDVSAARATEAVREAEAALVTSEAYIDNSDADYNSDADFNTEADDIEIKEEPSIPEHTGTNKAFITTVPPKESSKKLPFVENSTNSSSKPRRSSKSKSAHKSASVKSQKRESVNTKNKNDSSKRKAVSNGNVERKQLQCVLCNYSTQLQRALDEHMKNKHGMFPQQAPVGSRLPSIKRWESEGISSSDTYQPPYQVPLVRPPANNSTATTVSSTPSFSRRKGPRFLNCQDSDCAFKAETRAELKKHMISQHPSLCETLRCEHCDFTTKKRPNYRQHMKTHLAPENKPYKCTQCNYGSANKEGLVIHLNSAHKGVKPYLCDTCGQSFTGISMLSKHKLMKHKPKHLSCPHCDYKTSLQTWLKDHMKRHSTDTPFVCQFCSYTAKTAGRLKVHIRIHTGERPYRCHVCDYGAMEGAPLKKHLKNQHHLSVSRIDVREGKLLLTNGDVVETGLGTRTQPLPPGSFLGSKAKHAGARGDDGNSSNLIVTPQVMSDTACIISQAASLSALPVQPDSPEPEGTEEFTHLLGVHQPYQLPHSLSSTNVLPVSHVVSLSEHSSLPPRHS